MATEEKTAYWLFQSNPGAFQLREALRWGALSTFILRAHKKRIKQGDRIILWQTGKEPGCYGLATVVSGPQITAPPESERSFGTTGNSEELRVGLQVDYNCWNQPITPEMIADHQIFEGFNAGLSGVNYRATEAQFRELEQRIRELDLAMEPEVEYQTPDRLRTPLNLILFGSPGTGKTYQTINHALSIIENRSLEELALEERQELHRRFKEYRRGGQIAFVTFHQSFSYEDFVEGIKPRTEAQQVIYEIEDGIFKGICRDARRSVLEVLSSGSKEELPASSTEEELPVEVPLLSESTLADCRHYVLIIDEINRGNVPAIFGDLISLIEPDKREGRREALNLVLPYSKTLFAVPPNLHLIGTMNTTDRSVETIDVALRRRFAFREMRPNPSLIRQMAEAPLAAGVDLERLLSTLNARLERLLDREHCIGHAYFFDVHTLADLRQVFGEVIIPQLQEFFFNDYGKIGLVLGRDFIREKPGHATMPFADFDFPFAEELAEHPGFELVPSQDWDEEAFIRIYDPEYR